jgi:hypothetical protein
MRRSRIKVCLATAGAIIAICTSSALLLGGDSHPFSVSFTSFGRYSTTEVAVLASVTNRTHRALEFDSVAVEWKSGSGKVMSIHGIHNVQETMKPGKGVSTLCCVPIDSEELRVAVIYDDSPRYWQPTGQLALNLRLDRYPKTLYWLSKIGVIGSERRRSYFSSWVANPQGGANGRQPFSSETSRTSAAAASRRSP